MYREKKRFNWKARQRQSAQCADEEDEHFTKLPTTVISNKKKINSKEKKRLKKIIEIKKKKGKVIVHRSVWD